jgi:hypothetical protein
MSRRAGWIGIAALVVLGSRTLAYALAPSPLAVELGRAAGGPRFPVVCAVAIVLGVAVASAVVSLAALGVKERRLLEPQASVDTPRLRLWVVGLRAAALFATTSAAFTLLESYIHWRAGLGWHGIHCLVGPVHRNAIPLLAALSLVGAAAGTAVEHILSWLRRTLAALPLAKLRVVGVVALVVPRVDHFVAPSAIWTPLRARPPPLGS